MNEKKKIGYWLTKREVVILLFLGFLIVVVLGLFLYRYAVVCPYYAKVLPNTYLGNYLISDVSFDSLDSIIDKYSDNILEEKVTLLCNNHEYSYSYQDLGLQIDKNTVIQQIVMYQKSLGFLELYDDLVDQEKNNFQYSFSYDENKLRNFLISLKKQTDVEKKDGYFSMDDNRNLHYVDGVDGFTLDVEESLSILSRVLKSKDFSSPIFLAGDIDKAANNDQYRSIDTKVSSFKTDFNPYISRATNLRVALNYIDGAIIMPGEIFLFINMLDLIIKKVMFFIMNLLVMVFVRLLLLFIIQHC